MYLIIHLPIGCHKGQYDGIYIFGWFYFVDSLFAHNGILALDNKQTLICLFT